MASGSRKPYVAPAVVTYGQFTELTLQGGPGCTPSVKGCDGGDGKSVLSPIVS